MTAQKGLLYHIKDAYFDKVQDEKLMQNKEGGAFRPTFYCYKDPDSSIMWMIVEWKNIGRFVINR